MSLKSIEKTDVNTQELLFDIDQATFETAVEKTYQKQKKDITVQGFRKGHAPRKMVEKMYGEGVFFEDAINSILGDMLATAIDENKLILVDRPQVEIVSVDKEQGVVIKAICITKPEVTVPEYKGMKAPKLVKDVTDEDVDGQIDVLRQRNARIVSVDNRAVEKNDEVNIDFEGFLDGVAFDGGKGDSFALKIGSGQFIPGFEDQIIGHSIGEEFEINVTFPEEYQMTELAGKPVVFKIKINSISVQELPELDDDFVKDTTTDFENVADFRADMKKKLTESAENQANADFENKVFETLIEKTEAIIPQVMFDRRIDSLLANFEQSLKQQGMTLDIYLQYTGMDMASFRETFEDRAKSEVKLRLALEKIAELENIEVSEDEINEGLASIVAQSGLSLEDVKQRIPMEDYLMDLKVGKAADLVKDSAVVDNTLAEEKTEEAAE